MTRLARALCLLTLLGLTHGCGGAATAPAEPERPMVIILSLDGFRHDYPERAPTPHLDRMAAEGVRVGRLIPPFPSQTFTGHGTLATGVSPDRHGILNNRFKSRAKGMFVYQDAVTWYDRAPLWIHAQGHGVKTHVFHWVGSAGAYEGVEPASWRPFDKKITDDQKMEAIIGWARLPASERPGLVMSYMQGCDHAGHHHGPESPEVTACVGAVDARVGRLLATLDALDTPATLLIVSDHGMLTTVGEIDAVGHFEAAVGDAAEVVASGPVAHVYIADPARRPAIEAAAAALKGITVYRLGEVPEALRYDHPDRTGDLLLVAPYGHHFRKPKGGGVLPGHHGHDPTRPEMGAIFFAWGHGIHPGGQVPLARAVDLFPVACALLGLPTPDDLEGGVPPGLLE